MTNPHGSDPTSPRPVSPKQETEDILRTIMKVRKSWKTLKGNTEPVWPPCLEAMMLKGLQEYGPAAHSRFPQRNQFISDYIYRETGKHRSSKQIGSRLQQFKDTSEGRELIDSLTRSEADSSRRYSHNESNPSSLYSKSSKSSNDSNSSTCSSTGASISSEQYRDMSSSKRNHLPDTRTPVYIDILPGPSSSSSRSRTPFSASYKPPQGVAASNTPRPIRDIDPTVTFVSPSTVIGKSSYIVLLDGAPIHSEDTKLECVGPYFTALVPRYWETLCRSPVIQDVYRTPSTGAPTRSSGRPRPVPIFSATYHFRYPVSVRTPTSSMSPHFAYQANSRFLANTISPDLHDPMRPLSFQNHPVSPNFSEQGRFHSYDNSTQNRLDEPFILDGSLDNFCLDDFMTNIHDLPETTHNEMMAQSPSSSFSKNTRNYNM
ncbi:hypothetical protein EDD22DRAFT_899997 [Suillus occidentalis]|nr:hypothetical protein EDD22DRAFT_899997 [Suillus occidentalis]